ncbi:hypothetical protein WA556_001664, partial [Blastocystis sp. ATCC 50177/Nand II]
LFPVPARPFAQPPPEPVIRPQPVLQFQQIHVANTRAQPFFYPRYIAKVSLVGNGPGQIVSKFKIPDNMMVSSLQISPSNDYILAAYRLRGSDHDANYSPVLFHVYRQLDWRLYYEAVGHNDNANIAVWSPMMDGIVVGTEKGKLIIFRSVIKGLSKAESSETNAT